MCNNRIKFGKLFDYADSVGAEFLATGHYARLERHESQLHLRRGVDLSKDQSYVLFGIRQDYLQRMLLPVGHYEKPRIRETAAMLGLNVAEKKDSQEICFVTSGKHDEFVRARQTDVDTSGEIVTTDGDVVGQHPGIEGFTIGQRKGLGVAMGEPYFVTRIDAESNQVIIGKKEALGRSTMTGSKINWLTDFTKDGVELIPGQQFQCLAQFRYNSSAKPGTATLHEVNGEQTVHFEFDEPQNGIAPGQAMVLYEDDRVLGGGWIDSSSTVD